MSHPQSPLPWLEPGEVFPKIENAWGPSSDAPGLLAAGGSLDVATLLRAYRHGIFPWFSEGQPVLWWSTDPRMVLQVQDFKLHRSLKRTLQDFRNSTECEIRFDSAFAQVIAACASASRKGHPGTWIVPDMVHAYTQLHAAGFAHSVETWINDELVGGLYCVTIGNAVFGESMFTRISDASKIALAALMAFCRAQRIAMVDCQQNTKHLASLGARDMPRSEFVAHVQRASQLPAVNWEFTPLYWNHILGH